MKRKKFFARLFFFQTTKILFGAVFGAISIYLIFRAFTAAVYGSNHCETFYSRREMQRANAKQKAKQAALEKEARRSGFSSATEKELSDAKKLISVQNAQLAEMRKIDTRQETCAQITSIHDQFNKFKDNVQQQISKVQSKSENGALYADCNANDMEACRTSCA